MVYQKDGTDFKISTSSDIPYLRLTPRQAQLKDRFGIEIDVIPEKLKPGEVSGSIVILTNDATVPRIVVPVKADVQDD